MSWQYADDGTSDMIQAGRSKVGAGLGAAAGAWAVAAVAGSPRWRHRVSTVAARPPITSSASAAPANTMREVRAGAAGRLGGGAPRQVSRPSRGPARGRGGDVSGARTRVPPRQGAPAP